MQKELKQAYIETRIMHTKCDHKTTHKSMPQEQAQSTK